MKLAGYGIFGGDVDGFELAQKLDASAIWRPWLGDSDYALLKPHMASAAAWLAFMLSSNCSSPDILRLQLRVRALLFDKAAATLFSEPPDLQLHADSVYFTLEQDAVDWNRLQAEGSPALAALQMQHGLDPVQDGIRHVDEIKNRPHSVKSRPSVSSGSDLKGSEALFTRVKKEMTWEPVNRADFVMNNMGLEDSSDIWYNQWPKAKLMERMSRLAYRLAQQKCPIGDRDAFVRTPKGMATYLDSIARVRRKRSAEAQKHVPSGNKLSELGKRDIYGSTVKLELGSECEEPDSIFPEFMFPGNCVPDNPVPGKSTGMNNAVNIEHHPLVNLEHKNVVPDDVASFGLKNQVAPKSTVDTSTSQLEGKVQHVELSEQEAHVLMQQAVVSIIAGSGFEALKEGPLDILSDLLRCYLKRLGNNLRMLVDRYGKQSSEIELLQMYMQTAGASTAGELLHYMKTVAREQQQPQQQQQQFHNHQQQQNLQLLQQAKRKQMQQQLPQLHINQVQAQQIQRQLSNSMLSQLSQQHLVQQQLDRSKRRQISTPRGKKVEKVEAKLLGETTSSESPVNMDSNPYLTMQTKTIVTQQQSQQSLWQPQQSLQGMLQSQPHMLQQIKQHLSLQQHPPYQPQ